MHSIRRKIIRSSVALFMGIAIIVQGNLIGNQGFEDPLTGYDIGNWFTWGGADRLNWQVYQDNYSMTLKGNWSGYSYAGSEQKIAVTEGNLYEISFYHYWDNGFYAGQHDLDIDWRDANGTVLLL